MIIVCGWCKKKLGEKDGRGVEGPTTGICDYCLTLHFPHWADNIRKSLGVEKIDEIYKDEDNTPIDLS